MEAEGVVRSSHGDVGFLCRRFARGLFSRASVSLFQSEDAFKTGGFAGWGTDCRVPGEGRGMEQSPGEGQGELSIPSANRQAGPSLRGRTGFQSFVPYLHPGAESS